MSNRLAISAALSVLMMSAYVLFGADAARAPIDAPSAAEVSVLPAPQVSLDGMLGRLR